MNKYRIAVMGIIIIMLFLYMVGIVQITDKTNFSLTLAALIFSISSALNTYANENKWECRIRFILDTCALAIAIIFPSVRIDSFWENIETVFDTNVLLLLALFFTMAGQWSVEIKLKDLQNVRGKKDGKI